MLDRQNVGMLECWLRRGLYALTLSRSFNTTDEQLLATRKPRPNLAEVTADRTCVNVTFLQPSVPDNPHDVAAVVGAHRVRRHEDARPLDGLRGSGGSGTRRLKKLHFGAHFGENARIAVDDCDLPLHRRPLA